MRSKVVIRISCLRRIFIACFLCVLFGCGEESGGYTKPVQPTASANSLSLAMFLQQQNWPVNPLNVAKITPSSHATDGSELIATLYSSATQIYTNGQHWHVGNNIATRLPAFSVRVFSDGQILVPVPTALIMPVQSGSVWQLVFGEGRIWTEPNDEGYSRGQLTVTLVNSYYANAHNGLITFLYNEQTITHAWLQVFQENVNWLKQDFWGPIPLTGDFSSKNWLSEEKARYQQTISQRLPNADWQQLNDRVPAELLDGYDGGVEQHSLSATGIHVDGTLYTKSLKTRYGYFPYPQSMRHGVFSLAKSMSAALAVFHLNHRFSGTLINRKVADLVPRLHDGWSQVTIGHLLSMSTGTGSANPNPKSQDPFADETFEQDSLMTAFSLALTHDEKMAVINQFGNLPWEAGEIVRYNTSYSYLLGVALQAFLHEQEEIRPLWLLLQQDVYAKLGIDNFLMMHTQAGNNQIAQPVMGVGIYPTAEEAIKIALLFQQSGKWKGEQLLDPNLVAEVLNFDQQTGLSAEIDNTPLVGRRYHLGFWAQQIAISDKCKPTIPYMLGWGNNYMIMPSNGTLLYRFQDASNGDKQSMLRVANHLYSVCN